MDSPLKLAALGVAALVVGVFLPVYGLAWIAGIGLLGCAVVVWHRGRDRRDERDATRRRLIDAARPTEARVPPGRR